MAKNLILLKFDFDNEKKYTEESMETLRNVYLGDNIYKQITDNINLATLKVFDEKNSNEYSELDCILDKDIPKICSMIKNTILAKFLSFHNKTEANIKENLETDIKEIRIITNIYDLLEKKLVAYGSDKNVVVKIG